MNLTASSNKNVESAGDKMLAMIRAKYPEYHPVMAVADLAHKTQDEKVELACHQTIAKYVIPELKSIQIDAKVEQHRRVTVELFDAMVKEDRPKAIEQIQDSLTAPGRFGDEQVPSVVQDAVIKEARRMIVDGDEDDAQP